MNKYILILWFTFVFLTISSCNNEQKQVAKLSMVNYQNYLDSISSENIYDVLVNWEEVQNKLDRVKMNAEYSFEKIENEVELKSNLESLNLKYSAFMKKIDHTKYKMSNSNTDTNVKKVKDKELKTAR